MNERDRHDPAISADTDQEEPRAEALLGDSGPSLGQRIRQAREAKQMDPADLVEPLNLDLRVILNIEADQLDDAPGRPFIIAYIRSWADQLDLDPEALIAQYQSQTSPPSEQVNGGQHPTLGKMDDGRSGAGKWLTGIVVAVMLLVGGALAVQYGADYWSQWFDGDDATMQSAANNGAQANDADERSNLDVADATSQTNGNDAAPSTAGLPEQRLPALDAPPPMAPPVAQTDPETAATQDDDAVSETAETAADETTESAETAPAEVNEPLELAASGGDCWIEVRSADGERLMYDVLNDGERRSFAGDGPFSLVLGNPSVMEVLWEGEPVELEGRQDATGVLRVEVGGD